MLQPLRSHNSQILSLKNLWHRETDGRNGHWPTVPAWLASGYVERGSGGALNTGGAPLDQLLAREASLSHIMGVDRKRFGDSTGRLAGLGA